MSKRACLGFLFKERNFSQTEIKVSPHKIINLQHTKYTMLRKLLIKHKQNRRKPKPRRDFLPCMEGRKMRMKFRTPPSPKSKINLISNKILELLTIKDPIFNMHGL
jgi:hypothetical protein